jgi:DNA topoisomerase-1
MIDATIDMVAVDFKCGEGNILRANGSTVAAPGFMAVYLEGTDDKKDEADSGLLPAMEVGDQIDLQDIKAEQHFTEPPPRYTEATLVKALEEFGIGRPSTYASIISTLQQREYVELDNKRFKPTDVGRVVNKFLTEHFTDYVDYNFTARLEDELDAVSRGEKEWTPLLADFWGTFKALLDIKAETVTRKDVTQEIIEEACPKCGKPLSSRLGRRGRFIGCTGYPDCDYTRSIDDDPANATTPEVVEGRQCPECNSDLLVRHGRYGKFIGCSGYPKCRFIESLDKPEDTGISCPECGKGTLLKRKSRRGKVFYSCATYPDCKYAVWNEPVAGPCPDCGWAVLTIKTTKRRGTEKVCPQAECKFAAPCPSETTAEAASNTA